MSRAMLWLTSLKSTLLYLLLTVLVIITIFPFMWTISASFKSTGEIFAYPPTLIPRRIILTNYVNLFNSLFPRWYVNSLFVNVIYVPLALFFSALGGFAFASYEFKGKKTLFFLVIGSMMLPFQVLLVPLFMEVAWMGWLDSYLAIIVPFCVSAFGIFMMRQFMLKIPLELLDAARIDGCSEFQIFCRIMLPLSRPALGALGTYLFLTSWNSFTWPLIVLRTDTKFTLPLGLANLKGTWSTQQQWGPLMAGSFLASALIIIVFMLMQKQFIAGLTLGAVKE